MSQSDTITLSVDEDGAGAGTAVDHVYSNFDRPANRSLYTYSGHTPIVRDQLTLYRTMPKPTPVFYGVFKSAAKFNLDIAVDTPDGETTRSAIIFELSASIPIGALPADVLLMEERVIALLRNRTVAEPLFEKGMV